MLLPLLPTRTRVYTILNIHHFIQICLWLQVLNSLQTSTTNLIQKMFQSRRKMTFHHPRDSYPKQSRSHWALHKTSKNPNLPASWAPQKMTLTPHLLISTLQNPQKMKCPQSLVPVLQSTTLHLPQYKIPTWPHTLIQAFMTIFSTCLPTSTPQTFTPARTLLHVLNPAPSTTIWALDPELHAVPCMTLLHIAHHHQSTQYLLLDQHSALSSIEEESQSLEVCSSLYFTGLI